MTTSDWTYGLGGHLTRNTQLGTFRTGVMPEKLRDPKWAHVIAPVGIDDFQGQFYPNERAAADAVDAWLEKNNVEVGVAELLNLIDAYFTALDSDDGVDERLAIERTLREMTKKRTGR